VTALERLLDARGIALPDARRFLTEFLMDGAAARFLSCQGNCAARGRAFSRGRKRNH
jgi:hypothetical protein